MSLLSDERPVSGVVIGTGRLYRQFLDLFSLLFEFSDSVTEICVKFRMGCGRGFTYKVEGYSSIKELP